MGVSNAGAGSVKRRFYIETEDGIFEIRKETLKRDWQGLGKV
jgi:hypothetical protein